MLSVTSVRALPLILSLEVVTALMLTRGPNSWAFFRNYERDVLRRVGLQGKINCHDTLGVYAKIRAKERLVFPGDHAWFLREKITGRQLRFLNALYQSFLILWVVLRMVNLLLFCGRNTSNDEFEYWVGWLSQKSFTKWSFKRLSDSKILLLLGSFSSL